MTTTKAGRTGQGVYESDSDWDSPDEEMTKKPSQSKFSHFSVENQLQATENTHGMEPTPSRRTSKKPERKDSENFGVDIDTYVTVEPEFHPSAQHEIQQPQFTDIPMDEAHPSENRTAPKSHSRSTKLAVATPESYSYPPEIVKEAEPRSEKKKVTKAVVPQPASNGKPDYIQVDLWPVPVAKMETVATKTEVVVQRWMREVATIIGIPFTVLAILIIELIRILFLKLVWPLLKLALFCAQVILAVVFDLLLYITTGVRNICGPCVDLTAAFAVRACVPVAQAQQCFRIVVHNT